MAVIDDTRRDLVTTTAIADPLDLFAHRFWIWFYDKRKMRIASLLFWTIRLEDIKWVFEMVFGEMPPVVNGSVRPF